MYIEGEEARRTPKGRWSWRRAGIYSGMDKVRARIPVS
jgi:hypothetical protein